MFLIVPLCFLSKHLEHLNLFFTVHCTKCIKKTENALLAEISLGHRADVDFYYFYWISFSYLWVIANQQELCRKLWASGQKQHNYLHKLHAATFFPYTQTAKCSSQSYHIRLRAAQTFEYLWFSRWFTLISSIVWCQIINSVILPL